MGLLKVDGIIWLSAIYSKTIYYKTFNYKTINNLVLITVTHVNMNTIQGLDERLTVEGLLTLSGNEWLHADIIDAYLRFICEHNINGQVVQFMPTYSILSYEKTGKIPSEWYWDLKGVDFILAPAHLNNSHWAMTEWVHYVSRQSQNGQHPTSGNSKDFGRSFAVGGGQQKISMCRSKKGALIAAYFLCEY